MAMLFFSKFLTCCRLVPMSGVFESSVPCYISVIFYSIGCMINGDREKKYPSMTYYELISLFGILDVLIVILEMIIKRKQDAINCCFSIPSDVCIITHGFNSIPNIPKKCQ